MKTATIVAWDGERFYDAVLCKLSEPYYSPSVDKTFTYVVVSMTDKALSLGRRVPETMIFGSNENFEVPDRHSLASIGYKDRGACLAVLGYELES